MTWYERAAEIIGRVHAALPADADLKARRAALRKARPYEFEATSWGRKVWQRAQREYLMKFGYRPRNPVTPAPLLSPLERMKRAAEDHEARRKGTNR